MAKMKKNNNTIVMNLYVIYDKVAEESGPVFEAKNDAVAQRKLQGVLNDNSLFRNEFDLINIGSIDKSLNIINQSKVYSVEVNLHSEVENG